MKTLFWLFLIVFSLQTFVSIHQLYESFSHQSFYIDLSNDQEKEFLGWIKETNGVDLSGKDFVLRIERNKE